ncbi:hypothetical protein Patl1_30961 [Pistacia atlantica]|uniref:Uncharacterized protein n=1 Tax=Pistacia atlantica TaxID=434234 RepID=A0ACC1ACU8_9ROSI|nr:hypothetical protein Patl1_30961 [Pistacia atlantica]
MPRHGWRWLLALSSLPSLLLLLFYRMTPESPRYLCLKGRTAEARLILEKIAQINGTPLPSGDLVSDRERELETRCSIITSLDEGNTTAEGMEEEEDSTPKAKETENEHATPECTESNLGGISALLVLLSPKLIRSTLLLWVINGNLKNPGDIDYKDVFITSFAEFPGLLLSAAIVDKLGRKLSMSAMFFCCCAILLPLLFQQSEGLTTILLFGARICISGTFTIVYIYAPEIYPTSVRTTGVGVASSIGRIGGMVCPLVAVALVHGCHQTAAIVLFEIVIFLSAIATLLFPLETKGRELIDSVASSKLVMH